jgi:ribosomal protein S18 acetylase RimI-like enzyme
MIKTIKRKHLLWLSLIMAAVVGGVVYWQQQRETIVSYNRARDRDALDTLFKADWYWLVPDELTDFTTEHVFDSEASSIRPADKGNLTIKVYKAQGTIGGFIAYYKASSYKGRILFLVVGEKYRGKGFAKKLLTYAMDDLIHRGCTIIEMFTRTDNERALALYTKFGFSEVWRNAKYMLLRKKIATPI